MMRLIGLLSVLLATPALAAQPFDPFGVAKVAPPKGARAPMTAAFRDQTGAAVTLTSLSHGRPIVLVPVQFLCPNLCGLTLTGLDQAVTHEPERDHAVAALDIDPREGPAVAAKALSGLKTPITALTGPEATSRAVANALGYRYAWDPRLGQYAHVSAVAVLTPDGRLVRWLAGPQIDPKALAMALEEAQGAPPMPIPERLFLLCYHLITEGGRYDHDVVRAVRFMGGATLMALLLLIGWLIGRERRRARL